MFVYDVSSVKSFKNVRKWIKEVSLKCRKTPGGLEALPVLLVGNKTDLGPAAVTARRSMSQLPQLEIPCLEMVSGGDRTPPPPSFPRPRRPKALCCALVMSASQGVCARLLSVVFWIVRLRRVR